MGKSIKIIIIFFLFLAIIFPFNTDARSGCCSWHGGVCGCRCCDGSPLSAKCAPYYPSCNSSTPWPWIIGIGAVLFYIFYKFK
jgi:hypothetical protein